jgi:hypothetical protein
LGTLGARIDAARREHDPVSLANQAHELALAEEVSGKKASLTSTTLAKDAVELAKVRRQITELKAVQQAASKLAVENAVLADLKQSIADAQLATESQTNAVQSNAVPQDVPPKVIVINPTPQYVDIWVNGYYTTQVAPGQSQWFHIANKISPTVLKGYGNDDVTTWGPHFLSGTQPVYTWKLLPATDQ